MLLGSQVTHLETYKTSVSSVTSDFKIDVNLVKVNKKELLSVDNQGYDEMMTKLGWFVMSPGAEFDHTRMSQQSSE